jgi:hypothetical protein
VSQGLVVRVRSSGLTGANDKRPRPAAGATSARGLYPGFRTLIIISTDHFHAPQVMQSDYIRRCRCVRLPNPTPGRNVRRAPLNARVTDLARWRCLRWPSACTCCYPRAIVSGACSTVRCGHLLPMAVRQRDQPPPGPPCEPCRQIFLPSSPRADPDDEHVDWTAVARMNRSRPGTCDRWLTTTTLTAAAENR